MHECDSSAHTSMLCAHLPGSPWPSSGRGMHTLGAQFALGKMGLGKTWRQALEVGLGHLGKGLGDGSRYPARGLEGRIWVLSGRILSTPCPVARGTEGRVRQGPKSRKDGIGGATHSEMR